MGVIGICCKFSAVSVAVVAILIGALLSGGLKKAGLFRYLDQMQMARGRMLMGMFPATHEGTPWGFTLEEMPDLTGETFLVTGANTGLGYWTAHHMASKNGNVILGCRSQGKCEAAAHAIKASTGVNVETLSLDISSFKSIRAAAKTLAAHPSHKSLDGLVLNAGIMVPPFALTEDGIESQIGTNHFGHFLLTQLLMPQLEAAVAKKGVATVVSVSSAAHYDSYREGILPSMDRINDASTYDKGKAYGQSKLANVLFAQELSVRVKSKGILVNSIHPGGVDTELFRHVFNSVRAFSAPVAKWLEDNLLAMFAWNPRDAALTQLYCAVGPKVRQDKVTGKYFHPIAREAKPDPHAFNDDLQKHLWEMTENYIAAH